MAEEGKKAEEKAASQAAANSSPDKKEGVDIAAAAAKAGGGAGTEEAEAKTTNSGEDAVTQNKRVYVGNLSWSVTWRDLKDHMRAAGEVLRADVLTGYDGRSKGCGIVEYVTVEEANGAVESLNNTELMGRQIFVREDREEKSAASSGGVKGSGEGGRSVYVGNLSYEVAWQDLKDHMRTAGDVVYAEVMTMHDGRSKGCGIVEFSTADGAKEAIEKLNDTDLKGRTIFVREDREGGGGNGMREGDGGYVGGGGGWNRAGGGGRGGHYGNLSVYVGNLAYETSWQDLKDHMRAAGNVDKADILKSEDGRSKGCGIVLYQKSHEAARAIRELQNTELNGRPIFVREDREQGHGHHGGGGYHRGGHGGHHHMGGGYHHQQQRPGFMPGTPAEEGCQLFVGNLSWETGWRELKDHFRQCGDVDRAEVAEGSDGRKKGFGLIRFHTAKEAEKAIETLNGVEFMGRPLEVRLDNKV
mmetsp:Transcript_23561/g.49859  ORF Transcript_23561/g.49859 Transcript_23561/m.49859 type:complete len:471 (+) Transcript_23561:234-1646(+)